MTNRPVRLVTKAELLRRLPSRSKSRLYADCDTKKGGRLSAAVAGDGRIDLDHIDAIAYCREFGYVEPDGSELAAAVREKERKKTKPTRPPAAPTSAGEFYPGQTADELYEDSDDKTAIEIMDMTLREITSRYGRQSEFLDYVRALKVLTETRAKDEDAARKRKEHIPFSFVIKLAGHIDALQTALLSESAVAIATKVRALVRAGADDKQIEKSVHDVISRTIKTTKSTTERAIRDI